MAGMSLVVCSAVNVATSRVSTMARHLCYTVMNSMQNCLRMLFGFNVHVLGQNIQDNKKLFERHRWYYQGRKVNEVLYLKERKKVQVVLSVSHTKNSYESSARR